MAEDMAVQGIDKSSKAPPPENDPADASSDESQETFDSALSEASEEANNAPPAGNSSDTGGDEPQTSPVASDREPEVTAEELEEARKIILQRIREREKADGVVDNYIYSSEEIAEIYGDAYNPSIGGWRNAQLLGGDPNSVAAPLEAQSLRVSPDLPPAAVMATYPGAAESADVPAEAAQTTATDDGTTGTPLEEPPPAIPPQLTAAQVNYDVTLNERPAPETLEEMFGPGKEPGDAAETERLDRWLPGLLNNNGKLDGISSQQEEDLIAFAKSQGFEGSTRREEQGQSSHTVYITTYRPEAAYKFLQENFQGNQRLANAPELPTAYDILNVAERENFVPKRDDDHHNRILNKPPEIDLEAKEEFNNSAFGKRVNEFLPELLAGNGELPAGDAQAMEDLVDFAQQAGWTNMPEGREPEDRGSVQYASYKRMQREAKEMPLEQKAQEALAYLQDGRYAQNALTDGSTENSRLVFNESYLDTALTHGENTGAITADIQADAENVANTLLGPADGEGADTAPVQIDPQNFGIALAQRFDPANLKQNHIIAGYNYVQGATTRAEQQERLTKTLLGFQVNDKAGTPAMTQSQWQEVLNEVNPDVLDAVKYRDRIENPFSTKNDAIFNHIGVPGYEKIKLSKKRNIHWVNDANGLVQDIQVEKKQTGFAKFARPIMDGIMGAVSIVNPVVGAGYFAVRAAEEASKGNWVGAATNAFSAFGGYSKTLAQVGRGALSTYNGIKYDDPLLAASGALSGLSGTASATQAYWGAGQGIADFTKNASYLTSGIRAGKEGDVSGALMAGASLYAGLDGNQNGTGDQIAGYLRGGSRIAGVVENIDDENWAGALTDGFGYFGTFDATGKNNIFDYASGAATIADGVQHQNSGLITEGLTPFARDYGAYLESRQQAAQQRMNVPAQAEPTERVIITPDGQAVIVDDNGNPIALKAGYKTPNQAANLEAGGGMAPLDGPAAPQPGNVTQAGQPNIVAAGETADGRVIYRDDQGKIYQVFRYDDAGKPQFLPLADQNLAQQQPSWSEQANEYAAQRDAIDAELAQIETELQNLPLTPQPGQRMTPAELDAVLNRQDFLEGRRDALTQRQLFIDTALARTVPRPVFNPDRVEQDLEIICRQIIDLDAQLATGSDQIFYGDKAIVVPDDYGSLKLERNQLVDTYNFLASNTLWPEPEAQGFDLNKGIDASNEIRIIDGRLAAIEQRASELDARTKDVFLTPYAIPAPNEIQAIAGVQEEKDALNAQKDSLLERKSELEGVINENVPRPVFSPVPAVQSFNELERLDAELNEKWQQFDEYLNGLGPTDSMDIIEFDKTAAELDQLKADYDREYENYATLIGKPLGEPKLESNSQIRLGENWTWHYGNVQDPDQIQRTLNSEAAALEWHPAFLGADGHAYALFGGFSAKWNTGGRKRLPGDERSIAAPLDQRIAGRALELGLTANIDHDTEIGGRLSFGQKYGLIGNGAPGPRGFTLDDGGFSYSKGWRHMMPSMTGFVQNHVPTTYGEVTSHSYIVANPARYLDPAVDKTPFARTVNPEWFTSENWFDEHGVFSSNLAEENVAGFEIGVNDFLWGGHTVEVTNLNGAPSDAIRAVKEWWTGEIDFPADSDDSSAITQPEIVAELKTPDGQNIYLDEGGNAYDVFGVTPDGELYFLPLPNNGLPQSGAQGINVPATEGKQGAEGSITDTPASPQSKETSVPDDPTSYLPGAIGGMAAAVPRAYGSNPLNLAAIAEAVNLRAITETASAFLSRAAGAAGPAAFVGGMVWPSNSSHEHDGTLPGHPNIGYRYNESEAGIEFFRKNDDGTEGRTLWADSRGNMIGPDGVPMVDGDALNRYAMISNESGPDVESFPGEPLPLPPPFVTLPQESPPQDSITPIPPETKPEPVGGGYQKQDFDAGQAGFTMPELPVDTSILEHRGVKTEDPHPSWTEPSGRYERPQGLPETNVKNAGPEQKRGIRGQNEALFELAKTGYSVVFDPKQTVGRDGKAVLTEDMQKQLGLDPAKNPDAVIEGRVFDVYTPGTNETQNIHGTIQSKVDTHQVHRIVLNLRDSQVSARELRDYLSENSIDNLKEIILIDQAGEIKNFFPFKN